MVEGGDRLARHPVQVVLDVNDLPCLKLVGLPAAVADAYPEILPHCRLVTQKPGGHGAVREFCDLMLAAQGRLPAP